MMKKKKSKENKNKNGLYLSKISHSGENDLNEGNKIKDGVLKKGGKGLFGVE